MSTKPLPHCLPMFIPRVQFRRAKMDKNKFSIHSFRGEKRVFHACSRRGVMMRNGPKLLPFAVQCSAQATPRGTLRSLLEGRRPRPRPHSRGPSLAAARRLHPAEEKY